MTIRKAEPPGPAAMDQDGPVLVLAQLVRDPNALKTLAGALGPYLQPTEQVVHHHHYGDGRTDLSLNPAFPAQHGPSTKTRGQIKAAAGIANRGTDARSHPTSVPTSGAPIPPKKAAKRANTPKGNANMEPLKRRKIAERTPTPPPVLTGPILTLAELRRRVNAHPKSIDRVKGERLLAYASRHRVTWLTHSLEICDYFSLGQPDFRSQWLGDDVFAYDAQFIGDSEPFLVRAGVIGQVKSGKGIDDAKERCAQKVEALLMEMVADGRLELNVPARWVSPREERRVLGIRSSKAASGDTTSRTVVSTADQTGTHRSHPDPVSHESLRAPSGSSNSTENISLRFSSRPAGAPLEDTSKAVSISSCDGDLNKEINALIRNHGTRFLTESPPLQPVDRAEMIKERINALTKKTVKIEPQDDVIFSGLKPADSVQMASAEHAIINGSPSVLNQCAPLQSVIEARRLYVGNCAYQTSESDLRDFFVGFKLYVEPLSWFRP